MAPGARVLVTEMPVPEGPAPSFAKVMDLEMLILTGSGRERTAPEYRALFGRAGFAVRAGDPPAVALHRVRADRRLTASCHKPDIQLLSDLGAQVQGEGYERLLFPICRKVVRRRPRGCPRRVQRRFRRRWREGLPQDVAVHDRPARDHRPEQADPRRLPPRHPATTRSRTPARDYAAIFKSLNATFDGSARTRTTPDFRTSMCLEPPATTSCVPATNTTDNGYRCADEGYHLISVDVVDANRMPYRFASYEQLAFERVVDPTDNRSATRRHRGPAENTERPPCDPAMAAGGSRAGRRDDPSVQI